MIHRIDVRVSTPLYPTESRDAVERAIEALFPGADIEERDGELIATTHALGRLRKRLHEQEIGATAREVFEAGCRGDTFAFDLKKQAAHEGVVNFAVGTPDELGELHVRVRVDEPDVESVIDHLTDPTEW